MTEPHRLPIIVTVSGHRDLRPEDEPVLRAAVRGILQQLRDTYPATPLVLLTPLAAGADRLVARVAIAMGISFRVPMPLPEQEYRKDFDPAENAEFDELIGLAGERYAMPFVDDNTADTVGEPERRARQYAMVGAYIARASHVLIALWNGKPSTTVGGTAQIVGYRLRGVPAPYFTPTGLLDAPDVGPVYQIVTPRRSDPDTAERAGTLVVLGSDGRIDPESDPFRSLYERVERFNRDTTRYGPWDADDATATARFRHIAERLATHYQRRHHDALNAIFAFTTAAAFTLALGNFVAATPIFVLIYGVLVTAALLMYYVARRGQWQDRFIEYRAFEIGLTVQTNWDHIGVKASVADVYLRLQRSELDWVRKAIRAVNHLDAGRPWVDVSVDGVSSVRAWIQNQRDFFNNTAHRDDLRCKRYEWATTMFFAIAVALTVSIGAAAAWHLTHASGGATFLTWLEDHRELIALATIFAAVAHEYPRRRAFHAQARRYNTMFRLYDRALQRCDDVRSAPPDVQLCRVREIAREIGGEALAENGDWVLMHRELPIEMLHV
jgi:hypothetical protein